MKRVHGKKKLRLACEKAREGLAAGIPLLWRSGPGSWRIQVFMPPVVYQLVSVFKVQPFTPASFALVLMHGEDTDTVLVCKTDHEKYHLQLYQC